MNAGEGASFIFMILGAALAFWAVYEIKKALSKKKEEA